MMKSFLISSLFCLSALLSHGQCTTTYATITPTACDTFISPTNQILTSSGIYYDTLLNANGCDSVITIDLTIHLSTSNTFIYKACNMPAVYYVLNGNVIQLSLEGDTINLQTVHGCDSMLIFNLYNYLPFDTLINIQACDSFVSPTNQVYYSNGYYLEVFTNVDGCDSAIEYSVWLRSVDPVVSTLPGNSALLTVDIGGATYQWIDCNTDLPIPGATNQTFETTENGDFACMVMQNNCTDLSNCIRVSTVGLEETIASQVNCYPNPTSGEINLELGNLENVAITIYTLDGQLISRKHVNTSNYQFEFNQPTGVYVIEVKSENQTKRLKLIKI